MSGAKARESRFLEIVFFQFGDFHKRAQDPNLERLVAVDGDR
jgi:hypothetical protein